jgi:hypothetical protein
MTLHRPAQQVHLSLNGMRIAQFLAVERIPAGVRRKRAFALANNAHQMEILHSSLPSFHKGVDYTGAKICLKKKQLGRFLTRTVSSPQ